MRIALILCLLSFCGNAIAFSQRTAVRLERTAQRWENRPDFPTIKNRLDRLKPEIDRLCEKHGVDPRLIYGMIMTESNVRSDAVDFLFTSGRSSESHVGLGQLSSTRLPKAERSNPRRIRAAKRWQRNQTRANLNAWARLDSRFDPAWNLEQTIASFANNQKRSGDKTLAIMAHHGGSNDPIRRVQYFARDHEGKRIQSHEVSRFVKSRGINYFTLYEDRTSRGHQYWAQKRESHLAYALNVVAASKAAGYTVPVEKPEQIALQEGAKMNLIQALWNEFTKNTGELMTRSGDVLPKFGGLIVDWVVWLIPVIIVIAGMAAIIWIAFKKVKALAAPHLSLNRPKSRRRTAAQGEYVA